ncbi:hydrolase [Polynucleobacter sp. SHI8]|uniref:alpha/beta hydrolase n=1 Tax=unclassified Polynucleobacter TaxID=2640945 RepID=UPI002492E8C5|nr:MULTISPECIES: alpha/beta hydrolase [unclassified Polynucleobacter]BDW11583.1 hydrolase [Polynucleobacter sp. SHI2]BDW14030.1 hydrolase [Polynucleobacter sp. SHI8]
MPSHLSSYYYQITKDQLVLWNAMTLEERRRSYEEISVKRANFSPEVEVEITKIGRVTGEWLIPHELRSDGIIIHLHGGAFAVGNALTHRAIGTHLAMHAGCKVLMLNYRLCPEHPYPAALTDVVETFRILKDRNPNQAIALSGDSAGGNLAITATLQLQQQQQVLPNALGLMCPWTDLKMSNASHQTKATVDPYFPNSERLIASAKTYGGQENLTEPLISPQYAKINAFPPAMTHVGEFEALHDDGALFHQKLIDAQLESHFEVFPSMWHVWQHFAGLLPEATDSVEKIALFLKSKLP